MPQRSQPPPPPPAPAKTPAASFAREEEVKREDTYTISFDGLPVFEAPEDTFKLEVEDDANENADDNTDALRTQANHDANESATPISPLQFSDDHDEPLGLDETTLGTPGLDSIPQLDADRLEEIIRAQSRDIIEAVVRKIVPDLAESIIRAELERLIGDSGNTERPRSP